MKLKLLLSLCFLNYLILAQNIIFEDNFDRTEVGPNWLVSHGNWSIEDNKLKFVGDGTYSSNIIYYINELGVDEFTIDCKVMWLDYPSFEDGIVCFYKYFNQPFQGNNYDDFYLNYLSAYDGTARIQRFIINNEMAFTGASMVSIDSPIVQNRWYNFKVIAKRNFVSSVNPPHRNVYIKYFVDGKLVLNYGGIADSLKGNFVGLGNSNGVSSIAYYDDFKVYLGSVYPTAINDNNISIKDYSLSQNYPNPFNPNTKIEFAVNKSQKVKISIYNINGELIKELLDEERSSGNHSVGWDGKDNHNSIVPSGVYFYQIQTDGFLQAKKMVLLK